MKPGRIAPSAADLVTTARLLWPEPGNVEVVLGRGTSPHRREFLFVPDAARPRLLLPAAAPAAAATAVRRYSAALGSGERLVRAAAALLLRSGLGDRLFGDRLAIELPVDAGCGRTVEEELSTLLGEEVIVSLGLGNRRANQKPVLQVLSSDGRAVAFVKVGFNEVSRRLVTDEARALEQVDLLGLRAITTPRLIALHEWRDLTLMVLTPLRTTARRRRSAAMQPTDQMRELAESAARTEVLAESSFWARLRGAIDDVRNRHDAARLALTAEVLENRHGDRSLVMGPWHGDWTPWNMSWERGSIALWDWERFDPAVPCGFDPLHHAWSLRTARSIGPHAVADLHAASAGLLAGLPVPRAGAALVTDLYLLELTVRYCLAAQEPGGDPLRPRALRLLDDVAAGRLPTTSSQEHR